MAKYKKKPVEIEAVQWQENGILSETPNWISVALAKNFPIGNSKPKKDEIGAIYRFADEIHISTLEGVMKATKGDYIIRGVEGELYPCKPNIFEKTYEAVE